MEQWTREHVPELAGVLSVVSLALVFGAVLRIIPVDALPAPAGVLAAIPHVNAIVSLVAIGTILTGVVFARRRQFRRHRAAMLVSLGLFATFLVLYLYRVAIEGPTPFPGPAVIERFVYFPVLAVHVVLAVVCIPLLFYTVLLGLTRPVEDLRGTPHRRVGRIAATLWTVSFAMGEFVYAMLYVAF